MGDPTDIELGTFIAVPRVADWAQLAGTVADPLTARGSLFTNVLGCNAGTHPRVIGILPKADYEAFLGGGAWMIDRPNDGAGAAQAPRLPTVSETGAAELFGRACRIVAGTENTREAEAKQAEDTRQLAMAKAKAASSPPTKKNAIKLDNVAAQATDAEVDPISETEYETCFANYRDIFGADPLPSKECSKAQLSVWKTSWTRRWRRTSTLHSGLLSRPGRPRRSSCAGSSRARLVP
jgi:hypothetical protein